MSATKIGSWSADDPEWHAARAGRIGGSDVGVLMGWSPYQTRWDLLQHKAGGEGPKVTKAMKRGNYLEPAIAAWLADEAGVTYDPEYVGTWVDNEIDWRLYNPDAVTTDGRLCEFKTTSVRDAEHGWGRAGTAQVPLTYAAQCQWGLGILGLKECILAVLSGAPRFEFAKYRIKYDPAAFAYLTEQAERFRADLARHNKMEQAA